MSLGEGRDFLVFSLVLSCKMQLDLVQQHKILRVSPTPREPVAAVFAGQYESVF